jgi:RNA polymerase sigma-70 factor (ECF subfamily)
MSEDIRIIRRVRNGDVRLFSVIVEKYHRRLLNFIYRIVGDESIVEDIGQEVFLSAYKSVANFDETRGIPFSAWLYTIARNRCISELRKKKQKFVPIEDQNELCCENPSGEEAFIAKERMEAIAQALEELPDPFRTALLESLEGRSLEEIAGKGNNSINTVKTRIFRAKEKLKQLLHFRGYF